MPDVREQLIHDHLGLARGLALRYRHRGIPDEDLEQVARLGLVKAAERFRPEAGHEFGAYATPTITGELRRWFRDHGWCVRPPRRLQELRTRMIQETTTGLSEQELAARLDATVAELREAHRATHAYSALSLDVPRHDVAGEDDTSAHVDDLLSLRTAVTGLSDRERRILHLRFYDEATQSEIAAELGISQMQVSRLLAGILARLRVELGVHVPVRDVTSPVRRRSAPDGAPAWSRTPSSSSTRTSRAA
ncbi:sigma-70 family RNA polymerase sigma factor [Kineococcus rhizosphaerae]|uniref:RNA polymerase sigma-B factor n=1 Tax=Kineococcus rhizosphaerae TaxID=559628 RepID=A0A2T0R3C6_9ACTN|nr:sigma-70 family RNA polymerase sigma factor [Kineococcus rhizosphaerae]PRY14546.1 RNA polymerase sigma-B factor [Kineococcus rhizosphaerae]